MDDYDFIALDLETATNKRSTICEIGLAFVKDAEVVDSRGWLIKPPMNEYSSFNTSVHGINPEMTLSSPSFDDLYETLYCCLNDNLVIAHNSSFDMYALFDAFASIGEEAPTLNYYCSYRMAKAAFPGLYSYSLALLCKDLNVPFQTHHRAEGDAIGCANVVLKMMERHQAKSVSELAELLGFENGFYLRDSHVPCRRISHPTNYIAPCNGIVTDLFKDCDNNYFKDKEVCFTGKFNFGTRKKLLQIINDIGGIAVNRVGKSTNILVVGQPDYRFVGEDGMSSKQKKAMELIDKGQDLEIMSENEFLLNFGINFN